MELTAYVAVTTQQSLRHVYRRATALCTREAWDGVKMTWLYSPTVSADLNAAVKLGVLRKIFRRAVFIARNALFLRKHRRRPKTQLRGAALGCFRSFFRQARDFSVRISNFPAFRFFLLTIAFFHVTIHRISLAAWPPPAAFLQGIFSRKELPHDEFDESQDVFRRFGVFVFR